MRKILLLSLLGGIPLAGYAQQQEVQWKVANAVSASIVPLYTNQESPFPRPVVKEVSPTVDTAREAERQALVARTTALIDGPDALEPDFRNFTPHGILKGPSGWTVLVGRQWLGAGRTLAFPATISEKVNNTLSLLSMQEASTARTLQDRLSARAAAIRINLKISEITSKSIILQGAGGRWAIPLRQSED